MRRRMMGRLDRPMVAVAQTRVAAIGCKPALDAGQYKPGPVVRRRAVARRTLVARRRAVERYAPVARRRVEVQRIVSASERAMRFSHNDQMLRDRIHINIRAQ